MRSLVIISVVLFCGLAQAQVGGQFNCSVRGSSNLQVQGAALSESIVAPRTGPSYFNGRISAKIDGALKTFMGVSDADDCQVNKGVPGVYSCKSAYELSELAVVSRAGSIPSKPSDFFLSVEKTVDVLAVQVLVCAAATSTRAVSKLNPCASSQLTQQTITTSQVRAVKAKLLNKKTGASVQLVCR